MTTTKYSTQHGTSNTAVTAWHLGWIFLATGVAVSAYLSYSTLFSVQLQCIDATGFDCGAVQNSAWSKLYGIPVALLGLATYLLMGLIWLLERRQRFFAENGLLILFGIGLVGWVFSIWLLYVQVAILQALCQWCLLHEINFTLLFALIVYRLWRSLHDSE